MSSSCRRPRSVGRSATFIIVIIVAVVVSGCNADEEFTEKSQHQSKVRSRRQTTLYGISSNSIFNRTLRIVTVHQEPYTIVTPTPGLPNKYTFSGFIPDLIELLAKRLHFAYDFYNVSLYGRLDEVSGNWTGMIGEVIRNEKTNGQEGADIAAGPITITSGRERVVDFLKPFQHLGIVTIVRRPDASASESSVDSPFTFGIFQPFELTVWALILLSAFVVALLLWGMNMYNPYEWAGRHAIGLTDSQHADLFNLQGSFWFIATTFQWQGFEGAPRSIASKLLCAVWFAFVSLVLVTYTAGIVNNLYWASLTHRIQPPSSTRPRFVDLAHAVASGEYKFGTINNSQTYRYLMDVAVGEEFDAIRRSWRTTEGRSQLVTSVEAGLERVRRVASDKTDKESSRPYAFLMESSMAKHYVNRRPCDLVALGDPFGSRSHGFAIPSNMPYAWNNELHSALLELLEEGDVEDLERRHFIDTSECWNVTLVERTNSDASAAALSVNKPRSVDVSTFAGPFVLIVVGLLLSVAVGFAEMMYYRQCGRYQSSNRPQSQQLRLDPDEGNM